MLLKVEMESYVTGKRSKKKYSKNFKVNEHLWKNLCEFAENDEYSTRGKESYNCDTLYLVKNDDLQIFLKPLLKSPSELDLYADVKRQMFGSNIIVERAYVEYSFNRKVEKVDSFGFAHFLTNDKQRFFKVKLSDLIRNNVEAGDVVEISKLANGNMVVTDLIDTTSDQEIQKQLDQFTRLGGGY